MSTVKVKSWLVMAAIFTMFTFTACGNQATAFPIDSTNSQGGIPLDKPAETPVITASANSPEAVTGSISPENNSDADKKDMPEQPEENIETTINNSNAPDRVDVVYFHRAQRCVTCLCFEERITYVVESYFKGELNSGKLTYRVVNLGDKANKNLAAQYGAISSQLFVNSVKDGSDHIADIMDIWKWNCRKDKEGFDLKVRNIIESTLKGES